MHDKNAQGILEQLKACGDFLVIGHVSPDGDTVGSGLALCLGLQQMGKRAVFGLHGALPDKLAFMADIFPITPSDAVERRSYEAVIAVDCGDLSRLGDLGELFLQNENTMVLDHHPTNTGFGKRNLVLPYGATGQMMLELLEALGCSITPKLANLLYTAISTDTGNFSYANTDEAVLQAAARLRGYGADIPWLNKVIYRERTLGATRLIGRAIERLELFCGGRIAFSYVLRSDYQELGAKREDCDELINYARDIVGVEIAIFLRQTDGRDDEFRVSLRSNQYADVSALALEFGGGGHKQAAGCSLQGSVERAKQQILAAAEKHL